ncbi:NAD(P)H-dependent oxidoreductase [Maritalea porphyrae]|jgi:FMN-dependent NADH-azoreductase|uniref:FMN-dependent NADH-azoreductase n=1 Tax=Maritalea porphyrae TaxID=880732 RepID=UPI0022AF80F8|nr:NAD(P)H-dependent oxidoreductase [Maritalea porphyrae]MCZ4271613.1 NAD(P)H-dependent oxidoreductase [Maritalea porphyrae]
MIKKLNILRIDSSAMGHKGQSSQLTTRIIETLSANQMVASVETRDLNDSLPHLDQNWVMANNTPEEERTATQKDALLLSDVLVDEIGAADLLVIGVSLYNFAVPASLKAWIDLVCRVRKTFAYGENGPQGLMTGKKAIVTFSSGGTPFGSDIDFASDYMRHILGFIGISDVEFVVAEQHFMVSDAIEKANGSADALVATLTAQHLAA